MKLIDYDEVAFQVSSWQGEGPPRFSNNSLPESLKLIVNLLKEYRIRLLDDLELRGFVVKLKDDGALVEPVFRPRTKNESYFFGISLKVPQISLQLIRWHFQFVIALMSSSQL